MKHTQQEHNLNALDAANTLMLLDSDALPGEFERVQTLARRTALLYARANLLKYSAEYPQRNCVLCVCMGTMTLHVEHCVYGGSGYYQFNACEVEMTFGVAKQPPEFLNVLLKFGESVGFSYPDYFGPVRMHAHHGVLLDERTDW